MMHLDFLFIGPQRTGTSWIDRQFRSHPSVALPAKVKETFFFDRNFHKGLRWYEKHFSTKLGNKKRGEIAPSYFHCVEAPERISKVFPECLLVCTLRNPAKRLFSLYLHFLRGGYIERQNTFLTAIRRYPMLFDSSRYFTHLNRWIDAFGRNNVLITFYENLLINSKEYMLEIYRFIDVDPHFNEGDMLSKVNVSTLPAHPLLAKYLKKISGVLINCGCYRFVHFFRNPVLKKLFFAGGPIPQMTHEEERIAGGYFKEEMDQLGRYLKLDLSVWDNRRPSEQ